MIIIQRVGITFAQKNRNRHNPKGNCQRFQRARDKNACAVRQKP
jgi:hypothetical protein